MSGSPIQRRPYPAYAEEVHEESQCTVPGTRTSSQVRTRKPKRDEASDSGYATCASTSGSHKLFKLVGRMAGTKKPSKEATAPPAVVPKKTVTKMSAMHNLRINTKLESKDKPESREAAARIQLNGKPIQRTVSNKSQGKSPRSAKIAAGTVLPPPSAPIPIRTAPVTRAPLIRPNSYAGPPDFPHPVHVYQFSTPIHIPTQMPVHQPPPTLSYQPPPIVYTSVPAPMSPSRQVAYPFIPTALPQHIPPSWEPTLHTPVTPSHAPPPPLYRRYSIAGAPPVSLVEYPTVPHRPVQYHVEHSRPTVYREQYFPYQQDENLSIEDNEAYYRRVMPPPSRPPPQRYATTITTAPVRRSNRNSVEYGTPTSSRGSFSDQYRAPPIVRTSSSSKARRSDVPVSADNVRRNRPKSSIDTYNLEQAAEEYQAKKYQAERTDSNRPQDLRDAVERYNKSSKSKTSKASESGSRSSGSRKDRETRKTAERKKPQHEPMSIKIDQGCTATLTRDTHRVSIHIQSNEENKEQPARQLEREELHTQHSVRGRRESLAEPTRSIMARRPPNDQPTVRRERLEPPPAIDMDKRLNEDTAVEDDDYSEPEVLKKKDENLTAQRLAKLKTPSESPRTRSVRSGRSTTSSRRGIAAERPRS